MKKHYLKVLFVLMISALLISCGGKKVIKTAPSFKPYKFNANQYVPKVDNFVVILDTSSSMAEKCAKKEKAKIAKNFLNAMNQTLPELKYNAALRTFGNSSSVPEREVDPACLRTDSVFDFRIWSGLKFCKGAQRD